MKKIAFVILPLFILVASILSACGRAQDYHMRFDIDKNNYWEFLNITIVHVNPIVGTRLQFFPETTNTNFQSVVVTYTIFTSNSAIHPDTRLVLLTSDGRGQTYACHQALPRIVSIRGVIQFT
ncbi:MAG: hypothetical protein FWE16_00780 [Firmicutes bacterium]|nr:hypothetical protein [Bacillota bacterium]